MDQSVPTSLPITQADVGDARPAPAPAMVARVILLAGGPKPSPLAAACGATPLLLPATPAGTTLLAHWSDAVGRALGDGPLDAVICAGAGCPAPIRQLAAREGWRVVEDGATYRGPAGVLRDATADLPPDATVLVLEAARIARSPLEPAIAGHVRSGADATVGMNPDRTPAGLLLLRAGTLDRVPPIGYMDLKEQFLTKLKLAGLRVRIAAVPAPGLVGFRTRAEFLDAVLGRDDGAPGAGASVRSGMIVSGEARVHEGAHVVRSVIGAGCRVEEGAVVVRSIVTDGAVVAAGRAVSDAVVTNRGLVRDLE
ncbi:MAG: hypothetical protein SFY69_11755 [Planctomycetota bacterium]|nr:hypothetical protein [Planctomycetota bacterium]